MSASSLRGSNFERLALVVALGTVALGAFALYLYPVLVSLTNYYKFGYEGFVMQMASNWSAMFTPLSEPPYVVTIYPPVYMLLVGVVDEIVGNVILSSRVVSIAGGLAVAVTVGTIIKRQTDVSHYWVAGLFALLLLTNPYVRKWTVQARPDVPALAIAAVVMYWYLTRTRARQLVGVGILTVLLLYTKQSFVAVPIAVTLAIWVDYDIKTAVTWAASVILTGVVVMAGLVLLTEGRAWEHLVVANGVLDYSVTRIVRHRQILLRGMQSQIVLIALALVGALGFRDELPPLLYLYLGAAVLPIAFIGKAGSATNYFLEIALAMALVSGVLVAPRLPAVREFVTDRGSAGIVPLLFVVLLLGQFGLYYSAPTTYKPGAPEATAAVEGQGPILSGDMVLSVRTDPTNTYQPFIYAQLVEEGYLESAPLVNRIRHRHYERIVLLADICDSDSRSIQNRWTDAQVEAIRENYRPVDRYGSYWIYAPSDASESRCG